MAVRVGVGVGVEVGVRVGVGVGVGGSGSGRGVGVGVLRSAAASSYREATSRRPPATPPTLCPTPAPSSRRGCGGPVLRGPLP